jgi:site-specific DNA recombinase
MSEKAIIIARVSTARQEKEGLSLTEIQLPAQRKYAEEKGFEVVREFTFNETADSKIRRKFNEIIDFVKSHPEVRAIISFRVDRVTRNFRDAVLFDNLRSDYGKELHFVYDHLVLNKKSAGREIQDWDTKVYLAKQVINRLREDAINTAAAKLGNGEWPGKAPFGYRNVVIPGSGNKKWVEPDEFESMVVKTIYEWYGTGAYSMDAVRDQLRKQYDITMDKGKLDDILKNPFYYGEMAYDGGIYPHRYKTLISKDQFEKVLAVKLGYHKKHYKFAGLPYIYRGIIGCHHCGLAVTPEVHKSHAYYHCTQYKGKHGAKWLREENITEQFKSLFSTIKLPDQVLTDLVQTLKESHRDKVHNFELILSEMQTEYTGLEKRIEKMYEDKLDGRITQDLYDKKCKEYRGRQKELLQLASLAGELFESSEADEKRELLKFTLLNCTLDGKNLRYDLKKPLDTIFNFASRQDWLLPVDSNHQPFR